MLEDFRDGKELTHAQKFALITNLRFIRGGEKWFLSVLSKQDKKSHEKWTSDIKYIRGYRPMRCQKEFCPYFEMCSNAGTIIDTISMDRKVYSDTPKYYSIEEANECLRANLETAYKSNIQGIHLIPAQTALGKTTAYIELIEKYRKTKFLVALPTDILKNQVAKDLEFKMPNKVFVTPSIHRNVLIEVWETLPISSALALTAFSYICLVLVGNLNSLTLPIFVCFTTCSLYS